MIGHLQLFSILLFWPLLPRTELDLISGYFLKVTSFRNEKKNWATLRKGHLNFEANILCGALVLIQFTQSGIPNMASFKFSSFQVTVNITTHHDCGREAWACSSCHIQLHFSTHLECFFLTPKGCWWYKGWTWAGGAAHQQCTKTHLLSMQRELLQMVGEM